MTCRPFPDAGWLTIRDSENAEFFELEADMGSVVQSKRIVQWLALHGRLYDCPKCGRLMWKPPAESEYRIYRPEPPAT